MVVLIALAILATVSLNFRSNLQDIRGNSRNIAQFDRFNVFFLEEVKMPGNELVEGTALGTATTIAFTSGNSFEVDGRGVYFENADRRIRIINNATTFTFTLSEENDRTIITVNANIEGITRNIAYVMNNRNIPNRINEEDFIL